MCDEVGCFDANARKMKTSVVTPMAAMTLPAMSTGQSTR
jgi:hypothetical protein